MEIRKVRITESEKAMEILKETAQWLKDIGSNQWSDVLNGSDKHGLVDAVKRGEVFFYYNNQQLVGMFTAWTKASAWDEQLWCNQTKMNEVYYIHRIIIRPLYRRKGYGEKLLTDIKAYFKHKATCLRLDCLASNQKLIDFYKKNDFKNVSTVKNSQGVLFELFCFEIEKQSEIEEENNK